MRFFEFADADAGLDKFVMTLRNFIGRAASKKAPSKLNWASLQKITNDNGFEFAADYETFKSIYDSSPIVQSLVKNFNADGVELNVPGAEEPGDEGEPTPKGGDDSEEAVAKIAASAAPSQLSQNQAGVQA
jgi:hypothetical protein